MHFQMPFKLSALYQLVLSDLCTQGYGENASVPLLELYNRD